MRWQSTMFTIDLVCAIDGLGLPRAGLASPGSPRNPHLRHILHAPLLATAGVCNDPCDRHAPVYAGS